MKANSLAWCPTLPTVLLLASEDHNLYTFDVRNLSSPTQIYKDHVAAVMGCDWSKFFPPSLHSFFSLLSFGLTRRSSFVVRRFVSRSGPTGEEFVSGSWDRTIRIWNRTEGKSRDVYHTKRMQRFVFPPSYLNLTRSRLVRLVSHVRN